LIERTMSTYRIVIDTDPGIDDALAILLALAAPEIDLAALTVTFGNCALPDAVRNALGVLALGGGADIPVAAGAAGPLLRPVLTAPETHGASGLGYARLPATTAQPVAEHGVDLLIREILAAPGKVTLVAIGPLTTVALALRKEPRMAQAVQQVIIMGGALQAPGNVTPLAEFNIYADPHAAAIVLHSGMPITLLPWDITRDILLTQAAVDALQALPGPLPQFIADATRFYIDFHREHFGLAGCSINDPAALALVFAPHLARLQPVYVDVEIASATTLGKTVADFMNVSGKPANIQAVVEFDTATFLTLFSEHMEALARRVSA
jgi:purine nucleosidase